jgi:hypothetical protein
MNVVTVDKLLIAERKTRGDRITPLFCCTAMAGLDTIQTSGDVGIAVGIGAKAEVARTSQ